MATKTSKTATAPKATTTRRSNKEPKLALVKDEAPAQQDAPEQPDQPAPKRSRAKKPKPDQPPPFNPTIMMTWDGEPEPCWTGAFEALAEMNALDPALDQEVLDEMRAALREHGEYTGGGGAAPVYVLAVTQPEPPAAKPKRTQAAQEPDSAETAPELSTEPKPTKRATGRKANAMTLATLAEKFLAALEADGKSDATQSAYKSDLAIAQRVLGAETAIDSIRPADVQRFNESDEVLLSRAGQPKAEPTYQRTRRVLRLALDYAEAEGWIVTTPCVGPEA